MEQAEAVRKMALIDLLKRGCHKPSICKKKKKEEETQKHLFSTVKRNKIRSAYTL